MAHPEKKPIIFIGRIGTLLSIILLITTIIVPILLEKQRVSDCTDSIADKKLKKSEYDNLKRAIDLNREDYNLNVEKVTGINCVITNYQQFNSTIFNETSFNISISNGHNYTTTEEETVLKEVVRQQWYTDCCDEECDISGCWYSYDYIEIVIDYIRTKETFHIVPDLNLIGGRSFGIGCGQFEYSLGIFERTVQNYTEWNSTNPHYYTRTVHEKNEMEFLVITNGTKNLLFRYGGVNLTEISSLINSSLDPAHTILNSYNKSEWLLFLYETKSKVSYLNDSYIKYDSLVPLYLGRLEDSEKSRKEYCDRGNYYIFLIIIVVPLLMLMASCFLMVN